MRELRAEVLTRDKGETTKLQIQHFSLGRNKLTSTLLLFHISRASTRPQTSPPSQSSPLALSPQPSVLSPQPSPLSSD